MKSHPCFEKLRIFAPGPTPVPEDVLAAMAKAPLHHRTQEFVDILGRVRKNLNYLFQTKEPVYFFAASGTGAMEAGLINMSQAGDEVIVVNGGKFGERWKKVCEKYAIQVHEIKVEWGTAVEPAQILQALKSHPKTRAVLFQASETSTGTCHPVKEISDIIRKNSDALVVVDAITALGVSPLPMDEWGIDLLVTGSQKALMLPPGLSFLALSPRAQKARERGTIPTFYFDLKAEDKAMATGETAWTPAVSLICGLDVVLQRIHTAGLEALYHHHARLAEATRRGVQALGLELLAKKSPSNAVTAVLLPSSLTDGKKVISQMRDRFGITVAEGQDAYKGKMFRIAHLGFYDELDMLTVLSAVELTLKDLGLPLEWGRGVGAAEKYFSENR
jgi:aspartate aminotransferase-like enzyme